MTGPSSTVSVVHGSTLTTVLQGFNEDGSIPTEFEDSDVLTGTVWVPPSSVAIIAFTPTWFNAALCQVTVNLTNIQTGTLSADALYNVQVFATRGSAVYCTHWVYLQVDPSAGAQVYTGPPDLITLEYASVALAIFPMNPAQLNYLPKAISAASAAIRRYCGDRDFTRQTYTKDFAVIQGQVRLDQFPVNQIIRAQSQPTNALTISNGSAQTAQALFTYTGTAWLAQMATGITLNWTSNGVPGTASVPFTSNMVLSDLVTAINAVGSGWSASLGGQFGNWAVTELIGGYIAKGATGGGAAFSVYSNDLTSACYFQDNGQLIGIVNVGQQYSDGIGPRWGPDWLFWTSQTQQSNTIHMSYNAGFSVIPDDLQEATVEVVKAILVRLRLNPYLMSESAGKYAYTLININMIRGLPQWVRDILSTYRIHNA